MKNTILITAIAAAALSGCGMFNKSSDTAAPAKTASSPSTPTQTAEGVLIGPDGRTLYVFAQDVAGSGKSACVDTCAVNWPPLTVTPTAQALGDYSIVNRTDGTRQWAYKGMPLYYFIKDANPGDRSGDGVGGNWRIARR
ncbi:ATP-binding protein [Ottowia sp.]|uniref:COG4315 family predicted lipoprotein n=1 Tax=Ottowia sp. TaxID=1898956 RepID=UPI003A83DAC5